MRLQVLDLVRRSCLRRSASAAVWARASSAAAASLARANAPGDVVLVGDLRFLHVEFVVPVGDVHRVAVVLEHCGPAFAATIPRMPAGRRTLTSSVMKYTPSGANFTGVGFGVGVGVGVGVGTGVGVGVGVGFGLEGGRGRRNRAWAWAWARGGSFSHEHARRQGKSASRQPEHRFTKEWYAGCAPGLVGTGADQGQRVGTSAYGAHSTPTMYSQPSEEFLHKSPGR